MLLGSAAGALAACTGSPAPRPAVVDPDVALRAGAVERELRLVAAYDAVLAARPNEAARLLPLRAEHVAHVVALGAEPPPAAVPGSPSAAAPSPTAGPTRRAAPHLPSPSWRRPSAPLLPPTPTATVPASRALAAVLATLAASESSTRGARMNVALT